MKKTALVITSIADDQHPVLNLFASGCESQGIDFYLIGDDKSPRDFSLPGCRYFSLDKQQQSGFQLAGNLPHRHYCRKNIGYLLAISNGAEIIIESDDDNVPLDGFWTPLDSHVEADICETKGWVNVFRHFTDGPVWPRGFPLQYVKDARQPDVSTRQRIYCPVQQALVQKNPDVDAVYRLTRPLPVFFDEDKRLILTKDSWSPFNSQNTVWFRDAFPLMYLPATCSFRMTDIWRSFVVQRIFWENGWGICYHSPTVIHERNQADLIDDFAKEVSGYLNNISIAAALEGLKLDAGVQNITGNMLKCYSKMVSIGLLAENEMELLESWIADIGSLRM